MYKFIKYLCAFINFLLSLTVLHADENYGAYEDDVKKYLDQIAPKLDENLQDVDDPNIKINILNKRLDEDNQDIINWENQKKLDASEKKRKQLERELEMIHQKQLNKTLPPEFHPSIDPFLDNSNKNYD